ncbi:MAG TPA: glycine--tRNA ligase subunit beta, partial [Alcanivorax sp.]|nr:glycine--tRNA ligase subunit beta [Alcanivorax sp.]
NKLPIPKRMRWGRRKVQFVRPVHWLVALYGSDVIDFELLDQRAGRTSRGHRFHAPDAIELSEAGDYATRLEQDGKVIADFPRRREMIRQQAEQAGRDAGGQAHL